MLPTKISQCTNNVIELKKNQNQPQNCILIQWYPCLEDKRNNIKKTFSFCDVIRITSCFEMTLMHYKH